MSDAEYVPPTPPGGCPRCGAAVAWRPPARPIGDGAWEADFECANGHRMQVLSQPKSRPDSR